VGDNGLSHGTHVAGIHQGFGDSTVARDGGRREPVQLSSVHGKQPCCEQLRGHQGDGARDRGGVRRDQPQPEPCGGRRRLR